MPILVAADRGDETFSHTLPALNADSVKEVLEPVLAPDALLVSDANRCYPPVAAALDIPHESIMERVNLKSERQLCDAHGPTPATAARGAEGTLFAKGEFLVLAYLDSLDCRSDSVNRGEQCGPAVVVQRKDGDG